MVEPSTPTNAYQRDYARPMPPPFQFSRKQEDGSKNTTIPADVTHVVIDDNDSTEIAKSQFEECRNLQTVQILSTIASVGNRAFQHCSRLVQLEFPEGLESIKGCAFLGCQALETIVAPSSRLVRIGECAFEGCSSLRSIPSLGNLQFIGFKAFAYCESLLLDAPLPNGLKYIGQSAFINCQALQTITVPPTVELIWGRTFQMCTSIQVVTLHQGLRTIFRSAFAMCTLLQAIDIPSTVETIEEEAFSSCRSMRTVTLKEGLVTIGQKAFAHCESLVSISIPSTVYTLGNAAFQGCVTLVDVEFQEGLVGIGISTFADCHSIGGISFPDSLKVLRGTAFDHCSHLLGVEIPKDSDLTIYRDESSFRKRPCFSGCDELVSLSIPSTMMEQTNSNQAATSEYAFSQCPKLQNVETQELELDKVRDRFVHLPVHACCYHASSTTLDDLEKALNDASNYELVVDAFGMTPFHLVATSAKLRLDMLTMLLDRYPLDRLFQKDSFGKTMMDYLMMQGSSKTIPLIQMTLQRSLAHAMSGCSLDQWRDDLLEYVVESFTSCQEGNLSSKWTCYQKIMKRFAHYIQVESTSILELALWKMKICELNLVAADDDNAMMDHRANCRWKCGSNVVLENVMGYAWDQEYHFAMIVASKMLPLCSSNGESAQQ